MAIQHRCLQYSCEDGKDISIKQDACELEHWKTASHINSWCHWCCRCPSSIGWHGRVRRGCSWVIWHGLLTRGRTSWISLGHTTAGLRLHITVGKQLGEAVLKPSGLKGSSVKTDGQRWTFLSSWWRSNLVHSRWFVTWRLHRGEKLLRSRDCNPQMGPCCCTLNESVSTVQVTMGKPDN